MVRICRGAFEGKSSATIRRVPHRLPGRDSAEIPKKHPISSNCPHFSQPFTSLGRCLYHACTWLAPRMYLACTWLALGLHLPCTSHVPGFGVALGSQSVSYQQALAYLATHILQDRAGSRRRRLWGGHPPPAPPVKASVEASCSDCGVFLRGVKRLGDTLSPPNFGIDLTTLTAKIGSAGKVLYEQQIRTCIFGYPRH